MADRSSKTPKREGIHLSSVKRFENRENKSRSPILTRSKSRGIDDIDKLENSAIHNRRPKRSSNSLEEKQSPEAKKAKVAVENHPKKNINAKTKNNKLKTTITNHRETIIASTSSEGATSYKNLKKELEEKKTGSSIGTRRKADLEASKSSSSVEKLKKSASLDDFKNKDSCGSTSKRSLVMDQNASNLPNKTNASNNNGNSTSSSEVVSNAVPTSSNTTSHDIDAEDSDMSRLQTILESRCLPRDFLGGIPRMQNFFYRSAGASASTTKAQQLLNTLNSSTNESDKLNFVLEMCQLLLMGNEDTLVGFPIKAVVPALINLLSMEHNFEIMHHACRALTYMMEALPRSSVVVLDAIPVFLEKLQAIQCMDVAEQSLSALEMLSRRHNKAILQARGVSACLTYLDFFSIDAQRSALTITANCFQNLIIEDFQFVKDSLPILSSHLSVEDKKCIESICLAFSRLVDCYQMDCAIISEIASRDLLTNIQSVLMQVPAILSTGSFVNVIRMLSTMCCSCSQIAVELLKSNICETLKCLLLCNNSLLENSDSINLITRGPQEIYELTSFIAELMPSLPLDNKIFEVEKLFSKANQTPSHTACWQYKDDRGLWLPFSSHENKVIEEAHIAERDEIELEAMDRVFLIDLNSMQKIYEDTGTSYAIQRKVTFNNPELSRSNIAHTDPRSEFIFNEPELSNSFLRFIFTVLNEVYNNSTGSSVRHKCLNALLRVLYHAPKELLRSILKDKSMSSSVATMLASSDARTVVAAIQMCNILMDKMPEIFSVYFQREGVIHQIRKLVKEESRISLVERSLYESSHPKTVHAAIYSNSQLFGSSRMLLNSTVADYFSQVGYSVSTGTVPHIVKISNSRQSLEQSSGRGDEIIKRKRTKKSNSTVSRINTSSVGQDVSANVDSGSYLSSLFLHSEMLSTPSNIVTNNEQPHIGTNPTVKSNKIAIGSTINQIVRATKEKITGEKLTTSANSSTPTPPAATSSNASVKSSTSNSKISLINEKITSWIKEEARAFDKKYFESDKLESSDSTSSTGIMKDLLESIKSLKEDKDKTKALRCFKKILLENDLSSFEVIQSEIVKDLLEFLAGENFSQNSREKNLRTFLHIFYDAPLTDSNEGVDCLKLNSKPFSILVNKLNACVSQVEQFPLSIQDFTYNSRAIPYKLISSAYFKVSFQPHPSSTHTKKVSEAPIQFSSSSLVQHCVNELYKRLRSESHHEGDDDDLDDHATSGTNSSSQTSARHRLQILMKDKNNAFHALPYNWPLYQCIPQYCRETIPATDSSSSSSSSSNSSSNEAIDKSNTSSPAHILYYRWSNDSSANVSSIASTATSSSVPVSSSSSSTSKGSSRRSKSNGSSSQSGKSTIPKKKDEIWLEGQTSCPISPLEQYLKSCLSLGTNINDNSIEILTLLRLLYGLARYWGSLYKLSSYSPAIPLKEFINCKLTVKANRQLQDPMVIMGDFLPAWLKSIAYACPFVFPFDTRCLLFYVVSFDRDRALHRLIENAPDLSFDSRERSIVPRLEKRKRIVPRTDIYKSAESLFNDLAVSKSLIEIQYENEVGTGLGPTLEFYALVSREFQRSDFEMWRGETMPNCEFKEDTQFVFSSNGLYPLPLGRSSKTAAINKLKSRFKLLGKFMAKALMDSRIIDIPLNILFYKWILNEQSTLTVTDLIHLDPTFASSIMQLYKIFLTKQRMNLNANDDLLKIHGSSIEDLNLDFTLPGHTNFELRKGGRDMAVTTANLGNYIDLVSNWNLLEGVSKQMEAFKEGFDSVFDSACLKIFYPEELQQLFCGATYANWDFKMLMESCKTDHGYTHESRAIRFLFGILSSYNAVEQRKFLRFLTGSPRLPIGGFKSLIPPFTIVRKHTTEENPNCLPSVMTCVNYLKIPDYPSIEIMREKLDLAINEGQFSFHLS